MSRSSVVDLIQLLLVMQSLLRVSSSRSIPSAFRSSSRSLSRTTAAARSFRNSPRVASYSLISSQPLEFASLATNKESTSRLFSSTGTDDVTDDGFFADETDFAAIGIKSPVLLQRIKDLGFTRPTSVQAALFGELSSGVGSITVGAETGSGKTLAYLAPLIDDILQRKAAAAAQADSNKDPGYDYARAIILVPNKELVQQVVRMAMPLAGGKQALVYGGKSLSDPSFQAKAVPETTVPDHEVVRLAILPGGLYEPLDFPPFRNSFGLGGSDAPCDLVIATPANVGPLGLKPKHIDMFADIQTLIIDEADMLLDGGYLRQLENVLMGFRRADRLQVNESLGVKKTQHVFVAATLPDMGLRSVDAYLENRFPDASKITMAGMHNARHYGLSEQTVWVEEDSKKARMEQLVELLQQSVEQGGLQGEKVMVFLNSVDDVEGASQALNRAGMNSLPYHAKVKIGERTETLDRFRQYDRNTPDADGTVPILVCTDLASRGLDVPGVNTVVQLQFAGNVVAHLHRMGRCGRAGKQTGRGIVFYDEKERELIEVVREAEDQQERMVLKGDVMELDQEESSAGKVQKAFSRKRGFTKKRKKIRRDEREETESSYTGGNEPY